MGAIHCNKSRCKCVFLTVLTIVTVLSIHLTNPEDESDSDDCYYPTPNVLNITSILAQIPTNESLAKSPDSEKVTSTSPVKNRSQDTMWGCYVPGKRSLMFGRKLRPRSTLDRLECRKRVPDVIVIGVKKCGSQTLTGFLDLHPEIVAEYETVHMYNQACVATNRTNWIQHSPYSTSKEKTLVDIIKIADCGERVKRILEEINPSMKFIIIIRDPFKRAVSDYKHLLRAQESNHGFSRLTQNDITVIGENGVKHSEHVNIYQGYDIPSKFEYAVLDSENGNISDRNFYISKGIYVNFMKQVLDTVARQNLLVIDGEVFAKDPFSVVKSVESFLGVSSFFKREDFQKNRKGYFCPIIKHRPDSGCLSFKANGENPKVSESLKKKMREFYGPFNRQLEELLQQTFKW